MMPERRPLSCPPNPEPRPIDFMVAIVSDEKNCSMHRNMKRYRRENETGYCFRHGTGQIAETVRERDGMKGSGRMRGYVSWNVGHDKLKNLL